MGATFGRVKDWVAEVLTSTDLNEEIDNILENLTPVGLDDYSATVAQMKLQTSPGALGSESLPSSTAGEIERIRYMLASIKGTTYWYEASAVSLDSLASALSAVLAPNRIVSGRTRADSSQLIAVVPAGTGNGRTVSIKGAATNFIYTVDSTSYTISTDVASSEITAPPTTNNTCLVNDAAADDSEETKYLGEFGSTITVDAMGTEITALVGKLAGFKINNGSADEYFIARVKSTTELTEVRRGYFFSSADAPIPRIAIADNDTITLLRLSWVFATTTGTVTVTNTEPRVAGAEPNSPANGDYWFDLSTDQWKLYNGSAFIAANAHLVGVCISNASDTVAARTFDQAKAVTGLNTLLLKKFDATEVRGEGATARVNVFGSEARFGQDLPRWDMDFHLDTGLTEAASTIYYAYLTEDGESVISDIAPAVRDLGYEGLYHPHQTWRCVGQFYNNASSDIELVISYQDTDSDNVLVSAEVAASAMVIKLHSPPNKLHEVRDTSSSGQSLRAAILPGTSLTVASGSTLGTFDALEAALFVHGVLDAQRLELGISRVPHLPEHLVTTLAEGSGADDAGALYTFTARTSAPVRVFAKMLSTQTTAGTWDSAPTSIVYQPFDTRALIQFTSSSSLTIPYGYKRAKLLAVGGGASGGAGSNGNGTGGPAGGGGGGGAPVCRADLTVVPGATATITIGAGGALAAGTATNGAAGTTGNAGGDTTWSDGTNSLTFPGGGRGGRGGAANPATNGDAGGTNGFAAGGAAGALAGSNGGGGGGGAGKSIAGAGASAAVAAATRGYHQSGGGGGAVSLAAAAGGDSEFGIGGTAGTAGAGYAGGGGGASLGNGGNGGNSAGGSGAEGTGYGTGGGGGGGLDSAGTSGSGAAGKAGTLILELLIA